MPLHVMCDRWDIGGFSCPAYGETGEPVIFVYDAYEGGVGLAEKAYELFPGLVTSSRNLVRDCRCEDGCPSCIHSPKCGNDNQPLDKVATLMVLDALITTQEKGEPVLCRQEQGFAAG
jgi:DEAD/DEAH box helicase domain-containing protein